MITLILSVLFLVAALGWIVEIHFGRVERKSRADCMKRCTHLNAAYERLHAVSNSNLRGHPLVKWRHPQPVPSSDTWYWRARFEGLEYLFTEEALRTARTRGALHFESRPAVENLSQS